METKICEAIRERLLIEFIYDGQIRIVEPYILGVHKDTSSKVLLAYQVGGHIENENAPLWKLYKVEKMGKMKLTEDTFSKLRKGYKVDDKRFARILCNAE
ncbi:hypothetical protein CYCD_13510 [Tenuifilaceae bacterium CYCD]|nr:hypothetical protein CYCD_13510 [Tenuifilaceae bacterium CYCD]